MRRRHGSSSDGVRSDGSSSSGSSSASTLGNGSGATSAGERASHRDDFARVLSCTVVYDHRFVRLRIAAHDTIESLVELTAIKLRKKYPNESLAHGIVGLRSQRLEKDLYLSAIVEQVVLEGDILEVRPYTIAQSTGLLRSRKSSVECASVSAPVRTASISKLAIATFGVSARPGVFTVTPIKGEGLPVVGLLRVGRAALGIRLFPYEDVVVTPPAIGPDFIWGAPIHFKHTDPTCEQLLLHVQVDEDPLLGAKTVVGSAILPLQSAVDTPGTTITKWLAVKKIDASTTSSDSDGGRLMVSVCFHPKVSKGPTLQNLLRDMAQEDERRAVSPTQLASGSAKTGFKLFSRRSKQLQSMLHARTHAPSTRRPIGRLSLTLSGIHLCSAQCSKVGGHSASTLQDFAPIVRIRFGDFEEEVRVVSSDRELVAFEHEWPVFSCFSHVEVEVLRKVSICAGPVQRLRDGSQAVRVGSATISCHDIQERVAASWTFDPPEHALGPGRSLPRKGFTWHSLCTDDDEVGLAHIRTQYTEDLFAILDADESPDQSYVYPDERTFDPAIVLRNFERLDDIYMIAKSCRSRVAEILDWRDPVRTLAVWLGTSACCMYLPSSHVPSFIALSVVAVLVANFVSFLAGHTHKKWIQRGSGSSSHQTFRPVGTLRIVPVAAANLKGADSASPDTYVRMFYEPNYKAIPVHLIAQTECARSTKHPVWAVAQPGARYRDEFVKMNNRWLRGMFRHLSSHEQDAVAHDVVEPWTRADGRVDTHAFKYPVLQPVQKEAASGADELVPWRHCPGAVRFDVMQENVATQPVLLGRVRVPIKCLVGDEAAGGAQLEFEQTFTLVAPPRSSARAKSVVFDADRAQLAATELPSLTVRMQLFLRDPRSRVTLKETLASEALFNAVEMESQKELTLVEKYHRAKDVAKNVQQAMGAVCSTLERTKNLLLWVHPMKTLLVLALALAASIWFYFVPLRYILLYSVTKLFTRKFHKIEDRDGVRLRNLISTIPSDLDMRRIYSAQNQEFLRLREHTETQAKLQAKWAGYLWKQGEGVFNAWQERYCAVRSGRLEYWQSIADAKSGLPPKGAIIFSNVVDKCSKVESLTVPKDAYPLAIFDVSRRVLVYSPRGRRRLICAKTEEDFRILEQVIHRTGERIAVGSASASPE